MNFAWRLAGVFSIMLAAFSIATITVTLLFVREVDRGTIDVRKLDFVEAANWIFVGLLGLAVVTSAGMTIVAYRKYRLTPNYNPIAASGLKKKPKEEKKGRK